MRLQEKIEILSGAAKYDASCASSGGKRENKNKGLGNSEGMGICHSYTEDGRCVSLLKILLTNVCIFDCAYCVSRKSNDVKRVGFTVDEVVDLTINFYRRNYIEGLFLSSGIFKNADATMERLVRVAKKLRKEQNFHGYIHLKAIPGASDELIKEAGLYADRLSVNIELPSEKALVRLAPEKNYAEIYKPMNFIGQECIANKEEKKIFKSAPTFASAGQSTQLIVGASEENDHQILSLANSLYQSYKLKRVYYSGYVPVSSDNRLPLLLSPPVIRENRIYQADWLMRFYGFKKEEIVNEARPNLDLDIDPKLSFALRNLGDFPIEINKADYEMILRVPGIGLKSAEKIVAARKFKSLDFENLRKIGVAMNRARYFITCKGKSLSNKELSDIMIKKHILQGSHSRRNKSILKQLDLFQTPIL